MSGDDPKVNVELSRLMYGLEYEALIERKAAARKRREEEEEKKVKEKGSDEGKKG
jgi:hypothetical protein